MYAEIHEFYGNDVTIDKVYDFKNIIPYFWFVDSNEAKVYLYNVEKDGIEFQVTSTASLGQAGPGVPWLSWNKKLYSNYIYKMLLCNESKIKSIEKEHNVKMNIDE